MSRVFLLLIALIGDAVIGDPPRIWSRLPHPAALMGRAIAWLERGLNHGQHRRLKGIAALSVLVALAATAGLAFAAIPGGPIIETVLAAILLAQNSLVRHVSAVARALDRGLNEGRVAVQMIVGRDAQALDENGVVRSAVESVAENFSDGVVAPVFWFLVAGLPGIMVYKMVNTADSMVGYKNERYQAFGWASARLDDVLNWLPARLAGGLICLSHGSIRGSIRAARVMLRDAPLHRSPNAGWPESATAALVGIAISGPRVYGGVETRDPYVNATGRYDLGPDDIDRAVRVIWRAWGLLVGIIAAIWIFTG